MGRMTSFDGHTMGLEIKRSRGEHIRSVMIALDFTAVGSKPRIVLAELSWSDTEMPQRKRILCGRRLETHSWRRLNRVLRHWLELLEPLLLFPPKDDSCHALLGIQTVGPSPQTVAATGSEPDFGVWAESLESRPGQLVISPTAALFLPESARDATMEYLIGQVPELRQETVSACFALGRSGLNLAPEAFRLSRPVEVLPPESPQGIWGRGFFAIYPDAPGILQLSRAGLYETQALFFMLEWTLIHPFPIATAIVVLNGERRILPFPFQELLMSSFESQNFGLEGIGRELKELAANGGVEGVRSAQYQREPRGVFARLEVTFSDGNSQVFTVADGVATGFSIPEGLLLMSSSAGTRELLEVCARWNATKDI